MSSALTSALYSPAEVGCPNLFLTVQVAYISDSARFRTSPTGMIVPTLPSIMLALYSPAERPLSDISDMLYQPTREVGICMRALFVTCVRLVPEELAGNEL
jgi:hypothetical protein